MLQYIAGINIIQGVPRGNCPDLHIFCVCVCVCMCARVRACMCVWLRARACARHDLHLITFVRMYHHSLQYPFGIYAQCITKVLVQFLISTRVVGSVAKTIPLTYPHAKKLQGVKSGEFDGHMI